MEKRYQVFVSSTYADLKDERRAVIQALIEMDCIPAGMELFPAADEEQFKFIKRIIDDCDYYILIIGGRYGSPTESGISYTEQEFDYAVEHGLKILAFVHEKPGQIVVDKSELEPALREKLETFRKKVMTGRIVKQWSSADQLPGLVALSLLNTMKLYPAVGWIRANQVASVEVLTEINELRKQNAQLREELKDLSPQPYFDDLAGLDDPTRVSGTCWHADYRRYESWSATLTWRQIFAIIAPYLMSMPTEIKVKDTLAEGAFPSAERTRDRSDPTLDDQVFRTVGIQLLALGVVKIEYSQSTSGGMGTFWSLTGSGERLMMEVRTVRSTKPSKLDVPE